MRRDRQFDALLEQAKQGSLSRRHVLKRGAALGLSAPAISALLAACGGDDSGDDGGDTDTGATEPSGAGQADATPTEAAADEDAGTDETPAAEGGEATSAAEGGEATPAATEGTTSEPSGEGQPGGTLRVAMIGAPPTLDIHQTTATIVALVTWNMYESLFTYDEEFQLIPMLAESHEVSEDGLVNTVTLRQGVPFHNGDEMTAADVIASIERWGGISGLGQGLLEATDEIREVDDYTIEFHMTEPYGTFAVALAHNNQGCAIYPKSVIDETGENPLETYIGTGPYKFVERLPDRHIRFERFEDYAALEGEPNGYGGHKYQYVDRIDFLPVPDEAARVAGLQAGDFDYIEGLSPDQSETLEGSPNVVVEQLPSGGWETFVLNWESPLMSNQKIRQAVQAALNHEPIMVAGQGEGFYRLDPGVMLEETAWHSTAAQDLYNRNDPETAQQLLEEAGYDGTPLRFMTTQEYRYMFSQASVGQQQLEAAGFTIDLQVTDWATLVERRSNPDEWDIFTTGISFKPDPTQLSIMQLCSWPGWWCSDESQDLLDQLRRESGFETRYGIWEQLQENFYNEVPMIKLGDTIPISARLSRVKGFVPLTQLGIVLWNMWIEE